MTAMMEMLEGRRMFSATASLLPHAEPAHESHPAVVVPVSQPVRYQGAALDAAGHAFNRLQMTLTKTDAGYRAEVVVTGRDGRPGKQILNFDAAGRFTYDSTEKGRAFHVEGQLSTDKASISGTWAETRTDGHSQGTFSLTRMGGQGGESKPTPAPKPAPTPKPTPEPTPTPAPKGNDQIASLRFEGTSLDSKGETSHVVMIVTKVDGGYRAQVIVSSADGSTGGFTAKIDPTAGFAYDGIEHGETLHVRGQIKDAKGVTGSWTSLHTDGSMGSGTFSLSRVG